MNRKSDPRSLIREQAPDVPEAPPSMPAAEPARGGKKHNAVYKSTLRRLLSRYFVLFTIMAGIVFCALCTYAYIDQRSYAFSYVALNYAESGKGLAPNGTRYNMYDFISEELMERVIDLAALKDVSPGELADCVSISTRGGGGQDYISSGYTLSVELDALAGKDIHLDARSLLSLISKAYTQMFYERCVSRADALLFDFSSDVTASYEYQELADYYRLKLTLLDTYAAGRALENSSFRSAATGKTFRDIQGGIANLLTVDLVRTSAFISQTGIVKNRDNYVAKLAYRNYRAAERYRRSFSEYSVRLENIAMYDILQSAIVMVPTYDQIGAFYMSMTKTGVDSIATAAQEWNLDAAALEAEIAATDAVIASTLASKNSKADCARAEEMLRKLGEDIEQITRQLMLTDGDYIQYKTDNYLTFTEARLSTAQKIGFTRNALLSAGAYLALWYLGWLSVKRKERKAA